MVGDKLLELRTARGLSLRALAAKTGLSATLLSQIERDVTDPSLRSLRLLAEVFGQSVSKLFDDDARPTVHLSRPGERVLISSPSGHIRYESLAPGNSQMAVLRGLLDTGETSSDDLWSHEALECAYVVGGTLTVMIGETAHTVHPGEAFTFDSQQPHRYVNNDPGRAEFILSVTPPTP